MRLLLDTHVLFWSIESPSNLSALAFAALQDPANELLMSAATIWELAIKVGNGKIVLSLPYRQWTEQAMANLDMAVLPVTVEYADQQTKLPRFHRDPFDRLMISQSLVENIPIVSVDSAFDVYGVSRIW